MISESPIKEMSLDEALDKARRYAKDEKFKDIPSVSRTLLAEIERLQYNLEVEIKSRQDFVGQVVHLHNMRENAERYRWMRQPRKDKSAQCSVLIRMGIGAFSYELPGGDDLDAAVDAKRSKGEI